MIPTLYEPFRHWSDGGSVFILSDLHFDDGDCRLMDPDWVSPGKQLAIINSMAAKNGFVIGNVVSFANVLFVVPEKPFCIYAMAFLKTIWSHLYLQS